MALLNDLKTWRFWRHFLLHWFAIIGATSTVLQTINVIFPKFDGLQGLAVLVTILVASLVGALVWSWPRPIMQEYNSPRTRISIVKGDLLDEEHHLVIGTCDTFDTEPPSIISRTSLQGQALDRLFGGDLKELDRLLGAALATKTVTGSITKPGKTSKYGIGCVATVRHDPRLIFFLAYTEMDVKNVSTGSVDGVWRSLLSLWEEVSTRGNGAPVSIPVIGGGLARLSQVLPAQDSIRFIALSFMLSSRNRRVCDELRVVVSPDQYQKLDRLEIQSFLASLRAS